MTHNKGNIIPCIRYRNAPAALDWLCQAFGFQKQAVYPGPDNTIAHAQLTLGNGMIMVASIMDTPFGKNLKQPEEIGGFETQAPYVVVEDADAHCARAQQHGAQIVTELKSEDYGGRDYSCRDLEGHLWSFGTYDPWV